MPNAIAKLLLKTNVQTKYIQLILSLVSCLLESASECCLRVKSTAQYVRVKIKNMTLAAVLMSQCLSFPIHMMPAPERVHIL